MRASLAIGLALSACSGGSTPTLASQAWTLRDIVAAAHANDVYGPVAPRTIVTLAGQPLTTLSPPFAATASVQSPDFDGLNVIAAFAEGKPAAYMTAEVWVDWPPIWVQPLYLPVTAWDPSNPRGQLLPGALPVFSIGDRSTFYSPYWTVTFAVVPAGTAPEQLTNSKAILDRASELHPSSARVCSIAPDGLRAALAQDATASVRPLNGAEVQIPRVGQAWAEGVKVSLLDFGAERFEWDEDGVVIETPIFAFAAPGPDGALAPLDLPKIGGVGPYRSGQQGRDPGNSPAFGSLWRVYLVPLPSTAGVFVPPSLPDLRARVASQGLSAPDVAEEIAVRPDVLDYALRVALTPSCFSDPASFPDGCGFLDSQAAVEAQFPDDAVVRQPMTVNCPYVLFDGQKVGAP